MQHHYSTAKFSGRVYPCTKEFSFGLHPCNKDIEKRKSREYERIHAMQYFDLKDENDIPWMRLPLDVAQVCYPSEVEGQEARLNLGLSTLRNCRNRPKRYGSKGLTSYGARMVKAGAGLLEEEYGRDRLVFGTYTLPDLSPGFHEYLHEHWGEFVKRIFEHISRELERKNADCKDYVAVSEIQEKRYHRTGKVYLHLHFIIVNRRPSGGYYIGIKRSDRILGMVVESFSKQWKAKGNNEDFFRSGETRAGGRLERVKKSVVAYLGKYVSKGRSNVADDCNDERVRQYPRQWWTMSSGIRNRIKAGVQALSSDFCVEIANDSAFREACCVWAKPITKVFNGKEYLIGYVGKLRFVEECMLEGFEPEPFQEADSESEAGLDAPARIRIRRRRVPLVTVCSQSSRRRPEAEKAGSVKPERLHCVEKVCAYMQTELPF